MAKGGKISPIPKEWSGTFHTLESSLAKHGYYRAPGTGRTFFPYKEATGIYRTGLDTEAGYLKRMKARGDAGDTVAEEQYKAGIKRIKEDRARLEAETGLDLSPTSKYYNFGSDLPEDQRCTSVKMGTQDKFFDFSNPRDEITWNWLRVHPSIAPSYEAYRRGDVDPNLTQYFVCDDEIETKRTYQKKAAINKAIVDFEQLEFEKRAKIARQMGLPVTNDSKPEVVYNLMDSLLKEGEFKEGEFKGSSTIGIFNSLLSLPASKLHVKDVVDEAIRRAIYRLRGDRVMEGENKIADTKADLVEYLLDDKNQDDLLALEKKVKIKKIAETV